MYVWPNTNIIYILTDFSKPAASKWPTSVTQDLIRDFNASNDQVEESLRTKLRSSVALESFSENSIFSTPRDGQGSNPYNVNGVTDMDQLIRLDAQQFSSDMLIDSDVMSMWSATSGFQYVNWRKLVLHILLISA
jgi:hypothetical protein